MKKVKETKKYKILEIKKQSMTNRLKLDDYKHFMKENAYNILFCTGADIASIYGTISALKNDNIFFTIVCGLLSTTFLSGIISNVDELIKINNDRNKFINTQYKLIMGRKNGKENN